MADPRLELVIVALPREDDYVWKISSEKVPHMTLLYLGEMKIGDQRLAHIAEYIQHAASQIHRFGMSVDRRGKLGDKDADVLFFDKSFSYKMMETFRSHLLKDRDIYEAYRSTQQYPEWTPHLTLGYPEKPAKPDKRDYGFNWVEFDRIALWTQDSDGPTFLLKSHETDDLEVSMSADLDGILEHYGVKGMKWGVRKKSSRQTEPDSDDATRVGQLKSRVKTQKTTRILSNAELQDALNRMRLEQEFSRLSGGIDKTRAQKGKAFVAKLLVDTGKQTADQVVKTQARGLVDEAMKKSAR